MSQVLVTGASGFVGGHLAEALVARGEQVRCMVRRSSNTKLLDSLGVELVHGDLSSSVDWNADSNAVLQAIDAVYHVGALTKAVRRDELLRINGWATFEIARACARQSNPPLLVLMSSLAAAGTARSGRARRESERPRPISNYGLSKRAAELGAMAWSHELPVTVIRPGVVFGPRNREILPVFRSIKRFGVHAVPGFRWSPVSLIHVSDLIEITLRAAQSGQRVQRPSGNDAPCDQGVYFACSPETQNYAELGRMIGRAVGRPRVLMMHCPVPLLTMAAGMSELVARIRNRQLVLNLDKIREATAGAWVGSAEKVQDELGFRPPRCLQERLCESADWYLREGWM